MTRMIEISDVGPVRGLTILLPEPGGVVVLRGANGVGKDKAIEAATALLAGEGALQSRDRSLGGQVVGLGCQITVGRRTRRTGELEVRRLEGGDPSALVDPRMKSPEAADAERIRQLCSLARVGVDLAPFAALLGGDDELRAVAQPGTLMRESLPELAVALKRDIEARARGVEAEEENARGRAAGLRQGMEGVDWAAAHDAPALAAEVQAAAVAQAEIEARAAATARALEAARLAQESLALSTEDHEGPAPADAERQVSEAADALRQAELALERAMGEAKAAKDRHASAIGTLAQARDHERATAGWQATIAAARTAAPMPPDAEREAAKIRVSQASAAAEHGAVLRDMLRRREESDTEARRSLALKAQAERLRAAAASCEDVLSAAISTVAPRGLRVRNGRLVLETSRGETHFHELSTGERWRVGLDVAIDAAGPGALIPIEQVAWESLDPMNRAAIAEHARTREAVILTAECDGGELRATVFGDSDGAP